MRDGIKSMGQGDRETIFQSIWNFSIEVSGKFSWRGSSGIALNMRDCDTSSYACHAIIFNFGLIP